MADQQKKPRDIKDLKARLGRTVVPGQQPKGPGGLPAPAIPAPMGGVMPGVGGVVPPPAVRPPPGAGPAPIPAPVLPSGAPVAVPPFMQPQRQQRPATSNNPFAPGQASAGPREVRLVIDERPVDDSEVGRRRRSRVLLLVGIGLLLGAAIGYFSGDTMSSRKLYNVAVRDGKDIYHTVEESSGTVDRAKRLIDSAVTKASPRGGGQAAVDYEAIEGLRALKKPLDASSFARRHYKAFNPTTVDALFEYYNNVNLLWEKFQTLAARTLPAANRTELNRAAQAATDLATTQYGIVPVVQNEVFASGLVVVNMPTAAEGQEGLPTKLMVSSTPNGRQFEKTRFTGEDQDITENPSQYVVLVDTASSIGILGRQASAFAEYRALLVDIKRLMDATVEVQGRLTRELGDIAKLEEVIAF